MSKSTSIYIFAKEEEIDIIDEVFNSEQFWAIVAEMQGDKIRLLISSLNRVKGLVVKISE